MVWSNAGTKYCLATSVSDHPENWDEFIQKICIAYNMSVHPTTGFSPFFLMFRRQAKLPVDLPYGTPEPDPLPPSQYAATKTTQQLKHQSDLYNTWQHVQGWRSCVGSLSTETTREVKALSTLERAFRGEEAI